MRRWPYRAWLLTVVVTALGVSLIGVKSWGDTLLQHIPTVAALGLLAWWGTAEKERRLSDASFTLIGAFLLLHILGAHYLYSNVPYDAWAKRFTGGTVSGLFGWERNHYDRLVHFSFGLLIAPAMVEVGRRFAGLNAGWSVLLAVGTISIFGNVYEVIEWWIAETMSPEAAEHYNGQQGDVFDPQKDLALSFAGSVIGAVVGAMRMARVESGKWK